MSGLLANIFSAGDRLKRKVNGLLDDPAGTVSQYVGLLNDKAGEFNRLHSKATDEAVSSLKSGGNGWGPASQQLAGKLADAYNPIGIVGPQHDAVLKAITKGVPDDVLSASFGANGYVYHTPYRPFENAQQSLIGVKAQPIAERVFSTGLPLNAKQLQAIEAVPSSTDATMAFSKELADEGAFAFLNKDGRRFAVVMPSAKNQGQYQATAYDPSGAIGDSQHESMADAIMRLIDGGYAKILDESRAGKMIERVMLK